MMQRAKTVGLVTLVTILVWIFAEAESLTTETVSLGVFFQDDAGSARVVQIAPGENWKDTVEVTVEGSTAAIDALSAQLRRPIVLTPGRETIPLEPGDHTIDLHVALRGHPAFRQKGVSIADVKPGVVTIRIDQLLDLEAKVRVAVSDGEMVSAVESSPATVTITVPESVKSRLGANPEVAALLDSSALRGLPEGQRTTISGVRLALPDGLGGLDNVSLEPPTVNVTVTVQNRTASHLLASVPVQLKIPPVEYGKWDIVVPEEDQFLKDVTVSGPREMIEQIKAESLRLIAVVPLSFDDLEAGITSKDAVFCDLPTPLRFEVQDKSVRLTITRREEAGRPVPQGPSAPPG